MSTDFRYVTTQLFQSGGSTNPIVGEYAFTEVNFTSQLSTIGVFKGKLLLSGFTAGEINIAGLVPGYNALYVFKGSNLVWAGIIWSRKWDSDLQILEINASEMMSYYQHRIISQFTASTNWNANAGGTGIGGLVYTSQDALYMVKDLLSNANAKTPNGKTGITYAVSNPTVVSGGSSVSRTFFDFEVKTVYQAIKDLAIGTTYFDFVIKARVVGGLIVNELIVGTPLLGVTYDATSPLSTNLTFPGNIIKYIIQEDGTEVANYLYGIGYGANQNRIISKYYDNTKISGTNTWPLLESTINFIDIVSANLLGTITQGKLAAISTPPTVLQVVLSSFIDPIFNPNTGGFYSIGDQVQVIIVDDRFPSGAVGIYRIMGIDVLVGENNQPDEITLTLNLPLATSLVVG